MYSSQNFNDYVGRLGATVSSFAMATSTMSLKRYLLLVVPVVTVSVSVAMPLRWNCTQQWCQIILMRARNLVGYRISTQQIYGNNSSTIAAWWSDNSWQPYQIFTRPCIDIRNQLVGRVRFASTFQPGGWRRVGILWHFAGTSTQLSLRRHSQLTPFLYLT